MDTNKKNNNLLPCWQELYLKNHLSIARDDIAKI